MIVSLRTRLLLGVVTGTAVLLGVLCVSVYAITRRHLIGEFDRSLLTTARMLSAVIEEENLNEKDEGARDAEVADGQGRPLTERVLELDIEVGMTGEFNDLNGGAYYQFWDHDRSLTIRSPSLGSRDLAQLDGSQTTPAYLACTLPDGKRGRLVQLRFNPRTEQGHQEQAQRKVLTLVVARDTGDLHGFLFFMRWLLLGSSVVVVVLSTGLGLIVTHTGLSPVASLARGIESVHEDNLDRRFSGQEYPKELVPICSCLNDLFGRLKSAFDRQRQFNADLAHELRTPLAGIQSVIEVSLLRGRQPAEYQDSLQDCLRITRTMHRMIDTLLSLARFDSGELSARSEQICLMRLIEDRWLSFADKAHDKNLTFENLADADVACISDRDHLGMIVSNVLDNAVEYSDVGGRIWVEAQRTEDILVLSISNSGCQLAAADVEHVFDSFWRSDDSRTGTGEHFGIGLAVVEKLAKALGISVKARSEQHGVFTISLELPPG